MPKYQVWVGGSSLYDIRAEDARDALRQVRDWLGVKRLPKNTRVIEIPGDYYDAMVRNNQAIGIDISNW